MSLDLLAAHLALRNRALGLTVCTTGSTTLAATTTGYTRGSGSFIADNFRVGMEIAPSGFTSNPVDILTAVTAGALTVKNVRTAEGAAAGKTISVGLPALRAFENADFTPTTGRPYIEEDFVPATMTLRGTRAGGLVEENGLYVVKWYGLSNTGVAALRASVDALKLLFAPGTTMTAGSNVVRVRTDISVQTGQIIPLAGGWSALILTVPWWAMSTNVVAP